ncbi:MAG: hypothetical protein AB1349_01520 [Elusimicrobiota bacterium]
MPRKRKSKLENLTDIISFCKDAKLLNIPLYPRQELLLRVFYGLDLNAEQEDDWCKLMGISKYVPQKYQDAVWVLGSRSGKTTLAAAVSAYETICVNHSTVLRDEEYAYAIIVASSLVQAKSTATQSLINFFRASPFLRTMVIEEKTYGLRRLSTTEQQLVLSNNKIIRAVPFSSRVSRGIPIYCLIGDEIAYWKKESAAQNTDEEVLNSLIPRMAQFDKMAKVLLISTPGDKTGVLWDRWSNREKLREFQLSVNLPTWEMNPTIPESFYEKERLRDSVAFDVEFGAKWAESISSLLPADKIDTCVKDYQILPYSEKYEYYLALDPAFTSNRFGLAIGHYDRDRGKVVIDVLDAWEPKEGLPVIVDEVVSNIISYFKRYRISYAQTDQYSGEMLRQKLAGYGIELEVKPFTAQYKKQFYSTLKSLINQELIELPNNPIAIKELKDLQIKFNAGGSYSISHPIGSSYSDDLADCIGIITELCSQVFEYEEPEVEAAVL